MTGAVCPSCGVAVVPGYVRCPKCHQPLPRHQPRGVEGGTAVPSARPTPLLAIIGAGLIVVALVIYFGVRSSSGPAPRPIAASPAAPPPPAAAATASAPELAATPAPPSAPDAQRVASELRRTLERQRLWSQVTVTGDRVDVQSSSCDDPAMAPLLDSAAPAFKAAGLTSLRCLEQSGRVVTDRDL